MIWLSNAVNGWKSLFGIQSKQLILQWVDAEKKYGAENRKSYLSSDVIYIYYSVYSQLTNKIDLNATHGAERVGEKNDSPLKLLDILEARSLNQNHYLIAKLRYDHFIRGKEYTEDTVIFDSRLPYTKRLIAVTSAD